MSSRRTALLLLSVAAVTVGAWAQFAPASFFTSFPAGRAWVAADGPYNEHLIRDVGGLNLALALLAAIAAVRLQPELTRLVAMATLVYAVPHFAYHALPLEPYSTTDAAANIVSLGLAVVLPVWLAVWPAPRGRATAAPDHRTGTMDAR
jgi:hypothetical protein